jgi:hypothetical protein
MCDFGSLGEIYQHSSDESAYWSIPNFYFGISRQMIVISMACLDDQDAAAVRASWIDSTIDGTSFSGVNTGSKDKLRSAANGTLLCAKHSELFKEGPMFERSPE